MSAVAIHHETTDVEHRLAELGLSAEILREAISIGIAARNSCTENDPPGLAGILAWGRTTRALRERLIPAGWLRRNGKNLPRVIDANGRVAIAVNTGNEATGVVGGNLRTKYPKGPATVAAVDRNMAQMMLALFGSETPTADEAREQEAQSSDEVTWMLLIAVTHSETREARCELSLPATIGEDGRVEAWAERIILEPVPFESEPDGVVVLEAGPDIDVPVGRRS